MWRTMAVGMLAATPTAAMAADASVTLARGEPSPLWPGAQYDPAIPTPQSVLGYAIGQDITPPDRIEAYLRALAAAAPDRMKVLEIGRSWEGRPLLLAAIGAREHIARLEGVQADLARLRDPATPAAEAARLAASLPAPVWLAFSVHGDEISPADAALGLAYHLLAAQGDAGTAQILSNTLVLINPLQNPDGRARFVNSSLAARGLDLTPDPDAAERDQPWPGGRFNHYLFDLNRDWFAQTQPETRAHAAAMLAWRPAIVADLHEMGGDSTYFFPPAAEPTNALQTPAQMAARERIGRNIARQFDAFGFEYFTREVYDLFYPGYGDGWPSYFGAASMTYEQASSRGLAYQRSNGDLLAYADTVQGHFIAALATLEQASRERADLLEGLRAYAQDSIAQGRRSRERLVVLPPQTDQGAADKLARLLAAQGVEVGRTQGVTRLCGEAVEAGAYVIDTAQPAGRLVRAVLDEEAPLPADFIARQEERRAKGLPDEIYDLTGWSLPLLYNVEINRCGAGPPGGLAPLTADTPNEGRLERPDAAYGFLAPWGDSATIRFLSGALRAGLRVESSDEAFTHDGRRYPAGTLVLRRAANPPNLAETLEALARDSGAKVTGIDTSWVSEGPSFGSRKTVDLRPPRVALAWDEPASPTAAGATRFVIERQFGWPVTPVRTETLARANLTKFDVLILPDGGDYAGRLGESGVGALKAFAERGGVLIALGRAAGFTSDPKSKLSALRQENALDTPAREDEERRRVKGVEIKSAAQLIEAETEQGARPDPVAGALLNAEVREDHWLAAGVAPRVRVLFGGRDIYAPLRRDQGVNVVSFAGPGEVRASGLLWEENRRQLAHKPLTAIEPIGAGYLVTFTSDPTTRAFQDGLGPLFANAVFRAPAHVGR